MTCSKRKICVYSSSRADYGLLRWVMMEIRAAGNLQLQIVSSGMHLSPEFGMTIREIQADGFEPDENLEILLSGDTQTAICKSMGLAMIAYGEALQRLKPDIAVVLGDRFETFCFAAASQVCLVPLAHIHGGEATEGAIDEAFRHSITKMAHLHFATCEVHRKRIIQLGEDPARVFNVGALGVESIHRTALLERGELADSIGFHLENPYFVVTFHPVTLEKSTSTIQFRALLEALDAFPEFNILFTKTNADTDGRVINGLIDHYVMKHQNRCVALNSMGSLRYLSAMRFAAAVIGNSSSGILEAPSLRIPTVNIGDRQKGRVRAASVVDCNPASFAIQEAIRKVFSKEFQSLLKAAVNPYEKPNTAREIVSRIAACEITGLLKKTFYTLPMDE
ncbi:MAG: UDP-N-acetylglucosamine 2-epimerase (hydrolyzing) [Desulfobacteraceae bacterium]|nr:MAG: UDP-N-acetylglucosamine 2-epimerase (hydrolyzing) [Desulfobacteraceae bacterium]